jgi:hypothetical protein
MKTKQEFWEKENLKSLSLMSIDREIINKNLAIEILKHKS